MLRYLFKTLILGVVVSSLIKNRYRIMNWVLGNRYIRQMVVSGTMSLPFVKQILMNSLFSNRERTSL
ncbi:hypothetical protein OEV82_11860 [Caldibacillus thermolactis]|jgi:hypothetical protein|uniref:Uncharacterized protein n=1 Tax=Pallidibacillus thermolactis TaxID=251051 RepID=A0ABT2WHG7_9BACI|nr:hypothetical protein [Pallidibacillus thermolactis]MCU9595133.1 hypothetical protein [Pallidibacillus thermolactis]MED1674428.1 hypothetical protein [Pallidibacillus thermolactis subsp. kokeshiiformis]